MQINSNGDSLAKIKSISDTVEKSFMYLFKDGSEFSKSAIPKPNEYLNNFLLRYINDPKMFKIFLDLHEHSLPTFRHGLNVLLYSYVIGSVLECSDIEMNNLCFAAFLHDIGKIKISNNILEKVGKLTQEELDVIHEHPSMGYQIVREASQLNSNIRYGILQHHENYDGSGYPLQLKGNDISFEASIIHAVDIFDAITSKRSYHTPMPYDAAMTYIDTISTSVIAPDVAYVLLKTVHPEMLSLCLQISQILDDSFMNS